jgi:hypothetical protein
MQATKNVSVRPGLVILNKIATDSGCDHFIVAISLHEESPRITEHLWFDPNYLWD